MINVNPNFEKNTIYVKIDGVPGSEEINQKIAEFIKICGQMKAGFNIINDVSDLKSDDLTQFDLLSQLHKKIQTSFSVNKIIRVIGGSKLLLVKLLKVDEKFKINDIKYVATMNDAEKLIAN